MRVMIVGCGKVGRTLAEQLQEENIDLTLVDTREHKLNELSDDIDALGIVGNGASINTLMEAGIESTDILIAVTNSDELNLLCCLIAQKASKCHTIARVRNPIYSNEISFIRERLGLSAFINPEYAAAMEISRILRFPSAMKIDTFARGRVELIKFKVEPEFGLDGLSLSKISDKYHFDMLFCAIENNNGIEIPNGDSVVHDGDLVSVMTTPRNAALFLLAEMKISVKIIEKDKARCEVLCELLPDTTIILGDGTDRSLLLEEGLRQAEAVVALTNLDEENIFLSLSARKYSNAKLVAKVNRLSYDDVIDELDLGSVIYPKYITADYILQYVRAMQNSIGSNVETLYHILDNRAEALEFRIKESSPVVGVPLAKLNLRKNLLVACINRRNEIRIPRGQDTIQIDDTVIIVTTNRGLRDITDILER